MFKYNKGQPVKITAHGFTVSVDLEDGVQPIDHLVDKLAGSLWSVEGVGNVYVEYIGEMDVVPDVKTGVSRES